MLKWLCRSEVLCIHGDKEKHFTVILLLTFPLTSVYDCVLFGPLDLGNKGKCLKETNHEIS